MGKNSRLKVTWFSKVHAAIGVGALVLLFIAPVLALADSASTTSSNTWTETECKTVGGAWDTATSDCYTKEVPSPIMISVGAAAGTTTLTKYISEFYKFLTAGAAVLAVIYLMIGGFQILASAGGEQVGEGRKHITSALLGLVLVFCSYVLLQTVNPALVNLQPPRIKLIKANYLTMLKPPNMIGQPCWTIKDKDACAASCPAAGLDDTCVCYVVPETFFTVFAKATTWIVAGGAAVMTVGVASIASAAKAIGGAALRMLPSVLKLGITNLDTVAVAYGTYALTKPPDAGDEGVCYPMANHSIPDGGTCIDDTNCISPSRCTMLEGTSPQFGMCTSGKEGTACSTDNNTCLTVPNKNEQMKCCEIGENLGYCQIDCNNLPLGGHCNNDNSVCASKKCAKSSQSDVYVCVSGATGQACATQADCKNDFYCPTPYYTFNGTAGSSTAYTQCSTMSAVGDICCSNAECRTGKCMGTFTNSTTGVVSTVEPASIMPNGKCAISSNVCGNNCGKCVK